MRGNISDTVYYKSCEHFFDLLFCVQYPAVHSRAGAGASVRPRVCYANSATGCGARTQASVASNCVAHTGCGYRNGQCLAARFATLVFSFPRVRDAHGCTLRYACVQSHHPPRVCYANSGGRHYQHAPATTRRVARTSCASHNQPRQPQPAATATTSMQNQPLQPQPAHTTRCVARTRKRRMDAPPFPVAEFA
ncbi:MAG: hypothetical protein Ta2A_08470 [Treponemataceae bacterium]|nr:MAG: hypothetical protein Ta2A_08470 [Treponemataceae bacterium]